MPFKDDTKDENEKKSIQLIENCLNCKKKSHVVYGSKTEARTFSCTCD